jgi:hypothetical protein
MSDEKHVIDMLLKENLKLATEVDLLRADQRYVNDVMGIMARLLQQNEVPVPREELDSLAKQHEERVKNIEKMADTIFDFQAMLAGMRSSVESAGMRTGMHTPKPVTNEDIENILKQIDEI